MNEERYLKEDGYLDLSGFTADQREEIEEGLLEGLDVSIYAKPEFLAIQMYQIRLGLEEKLAVEKYAMPEFDWFQMDEIRKGLESDVDISKYAQPEISFDVMRQIRQGLESGIDLSGNKWFQAGVLKEFRIASCENIDIRKYIKAGYQEEQLKQIRIALEKKIDIDPYINNSQRGASIREIVLGLEKRIDVAAYADNNMNWQQMREIRLGLEKRLDVAQYQNVLYSWQQMREIRLGLEENLDVQKYSSFMYTAREMKKRRLKLLEKTWNSKKQTGQNEKKEYKEFALMINEDRMKAYIMLLNQDGKVSTKSVIAALEEKHIFTGIDYDAIEKLEREGTKEMMVCVAKGTEPQTGADGWYEYFFETDVKAKPKLLDNGCVDYNNIKWFEVVKKDQTVAVYHEAAEGKAGNTVTGEVIPGIKGKELAPLTGFGFRVLEDRKTYVAATDGKVDLKNRQLEITNLLVLDDVTKANGNVSFEGSVYIRGVVGDGVEIRAGKDILIDGFTESAVLEAGGDVILRKGNNPGGKGYIKAANDVMGNFFENARIIAGRDIKANYCLNSDIHAEKDIEIAGEIGILAGGRAYAGAVIQSHYIGNEAGIPTVIKVGREEQYLKAKNELADRESHVNKELVLLNNAYHDIQRNYPPEERNNNPLYIKIENAIYTKELELKDIEKEKKRLDEELPKIKIAKLVVKGTVFPGVRVDVNGARWRSQKTSNITIRKKDGVISIYRNI